MDYRNPYADKLLQYRDVARGDDEIYSFHSKWREHFLSQNPEKFILEIGCSNGAYLRALALKHPRHIFIGMDWKFKVLCKGAEWAHKLNMKNMMFLRGRAQEIERMFSAEELDEIWLFFPDPWAKKSQLKNRLMNEIFLQSAARTLKSEGRFIFKTDHPGYYQWVLALFGKRSQELPEYDLQEAESGKGMKFKQIRLRKPMHEDDFPPESNKLTALFEVGRVSENFWMDSELSKEIFSDEKTLFEKGFVEQKLPIYFVELIKKTAPSKAP